MRYFKNSNQEVFGYDETQQDFVDAAIAANWEEVTGNWPPPKTIEEAKAGKRFAIIAARNAKITGGFTYLGKPFDSDPNSVMSITGAGVAALAAKAAGQPFSVTWTCADDSTIALNADEVLGLVAALAAFADAEHTNARPLKEAVKNATSVEALEAIPNTLD